MTKEEEKQVRYLESEIRCLTEVMHILRKELQYYIDRCDYGLVKSEVTYPRFKEALLRVDNLRRLYKP